MKVLRTLHLRPLHWSGSNTVTAAHTAKEPPTTTILRTVLRMMMERALTMMELGLLFTDQRLCRLCLVMFVEPVLLCPSNLRDSRLHPL